MNHAMFAVIKKDFRGITANKRLFSSLWIVPLMLTVVLPLHSDARHSFCAGGSGFPGSFLKCFPRLAGPALRNT